MRTGIIALAFVVVLGAVSALVADSWLAMGGVSMGWTGIVAMIVGILLTLGLGIGLMALSFYSNRSGHDAEVDAYHREQGGPVRPDQRDS
ncbi:hypothetical protein SAMN05216241_102192 [Limimonas halophila]|uniref:Uncharacterized protein n=1 Tax=Limimonas halophila TaxID=1082479 RepID=A0A1G7NJ53_9PROT|nr:hypothetical protein [Limimonas halophila]SDF74145.1 hypothetical protein SAMN05216241_102192 [Limimonas halophila]